MGSYRSKGFKIDIETIPEQEPEPDYEIKTRTPKPDRWQLNILRGRREDELRGLAYAYARYMGVFKFRRKCKKPALEFIQCENENGILWTAFEC
jgi:Cytochrome c oxidase biogenesis protein Cmc1 like